MEGSRDGARVVQEWAMPQLMDPCRRHGFSLAHVCVCERTESLNHVAVTCIGV